MSVVVTDERTALNDADATTNWTGSPILFTADPDPIEATGHIGYVVSSATVDSYVTIGSTSFTGKVVYAWALPLGAMDSLANGGVAIIVGDGTNRVAYHLAGSDVAGFRHNSGQPSYQCLVLDQSALPTQKTVRAGSEGSLNWGAITQVGVMFKTLAKSKGGVSNCFVDILRLWDTTLANGCALTVTGGTSGDPGTLEQVATEDASTATSKAHGVIHKLGAGAYGAQGALRFGNATGTSSSWFEDKNGTLVFEQRGLTTSRYKIVIVDNGTGTTTFRLGTKVGSGVTATGADGYVITAAAGVGWAFDAATDPDVTDVFIYGTTFNGATGGVTFRSGHEFIGGVISNSGAVEPNGATLVNTSIVGSTVSADASALIWNTATDPDGFLDGTSYSKGTNAHHAIEFGLSSPTSITLRGISFTGFSASNEQNDSTFHVRRTTGTVTINVVGCSGNFSYKSDGATVVIVQNPVTTTITAVDATTGNVIQGARALVLAGTSFVGGAAVSITRSGTTATVTHTSHGFSTGNMVRIHGADQPEYNGIHTITVTGTNQYTYSVSGSPATPATGSIVSALVIIDGVTNASGQVSDTRSWGSNQTFVGRIRRGSTSPVYKAQPVSGTIDNAAGAQVTASLISDA